MLTLLAVFAALVLVIGLVGVIAAGVVWALADGDDGREEW